MPRLFAVIAWAVVLTQGSPLSAQWPRYQVPGVPRTADGKPNLEAPAPRTPDGKPDLSGIWENFRKPEQKVQSVNAAFFNEPVPTLINEFRDIGASMKDGLPLQPWAAALKKERMASNSMDNPDAHCLPLGNIQLHTHVDPRRILQTPSLIAIIYEANYGLRQIYLDGRPAPDNDPQPWWYGYSRGRWEGDTLVVETTTLQGRRLARHQRQPADGCREDDGAISTSELRHARDPGDGRRSESVHAAVDGHVDATDHGGHGDDRVHLQREREELTALRQVAI